MTNHGVVVAELSPASNVSELDRLRALGQVRDATTPASAVWDIEAVPSSVSTEAMIDDLRGPRR